MAPSAVTRKQALEGFTLIEVLLALAVIAIALSALIKSTSQSITVTQRIQNKFVSHIVAMQGIKIIQLNLLPINNSTSQVTNILGERWYWRANLSSTPIKTMQKITITVSKNSSGPFIDALIAYRITGDNK